MRAIYWLVGAASVLFAVGGVGVIAAFADRWEPATRAVFMYIFLAGLAPTVALIALACAVGVYHTWITRVQQRYPVGWLARSDEPKHVA